MFKPKLFGVHRANFTTWNVKLYLQKNQILFKCNALALVRSLRQYKQSNIANTVSHLKFVLIWLTPEVKYIYVSWASIGGLDLVLCVK